MQHSHALQNRDIYTIVPSGRGVSCGIMFTNIKPPQRIPRIHTTLIVFLKASLSHTVCQEVRTPKTHTPANYQSVHAKNALSHIPAHYVVMYEWHMSHLLLHVKLLEEGMQSLLKAAFMCVFS